MQKGFCLLFAALIITSLISTGCNNNFGRNFDMNVEFIREGTFYTNPNIKIGNAFDQFFRNGKWHSFLSADGVQIVEFSGEVAKQRTKTEIEMLQLSTGNLNSNFSDSKYKNQSMRIVIQFMINGVGFDTRYVEINGVPMNKMMMLAIIEKILSEYRMVPAK